MRALGYALFLVGLFLAAGFAARAIPESEMHGTGPDGAITSADRLDAWGEKAGGVFAGGLLLMVVGGVVARRGTRAAESAAHAEAGHAPLGDELRAMQRVLAGLPDGEPSAHAEELRAQLDELLESKVPSFLERRTELINELGLGGYAGLMGAFAGMERAAARAWSALTDEAWGEVPDTLARARQGIEHSIELYEAGASKPPASTEA